MRRATLAILTVWGLVFLVPGAVSAQSQSQSQEKEQAKPQTESLAEAARKARAKKQQQGQTAAKVYTNDNVPKTGGVSVVGSEQQAAAQPAKGEGQQGEENQECLEECWRAKFTAARKQLTDAEKELDILQRELNLKQTQYYSDPQKTLQEELERKEINDHRAKIEAKQAEVNNLKKAMEDLETELRRAGGNPGWARP